ncbi:MAG: hypothetical protein HYZ49_13435 [Chloroflexi bacterium]|nr:hypothetical protein [Chloroflexota bacterium]
MSTGTPPSQPTPTPPPTSSDLTPEQRRLALIAIVMTLIVVAGIVAAVYFMVQNPSATTVIRDIFIIFMAVESLFIGFALVILMIQLARLTNLLQHEIKPILESTNETVNTVRGTAIFVSENIVEPVMKLNGYVAALSKFFDLINVIKK